MTAFMLTGAYWYPSPNISGSVSRDILFCDPVIGVKLALSDTRGPYMDAADLARLASDVFVAALIANKPGIITVHTGIRPQALDLIMEVIKNPGIRPAMFVPTHINRKNPKLLEQVFELAKCGGMVDATCRKDVNPDSENMSAADLQCSPRKMIFWIMLPSALMLVVRFQSGMEIIAELPEWVLELLRH